ncbi:MAG: META domain-containing protein, partial [Muribaculaceae bacterium]|nr:META domain-containing protein [Muribaculaceae bacterium]
PMCIRYRYMLPMMLLGVLPLGSCSSLNGGKKSDVKKEVVLPTDREKIVQAVSAVYTSEDLEKGIVKGDWAIEKVNGKTAVGEKAPYLKFVPDEKRVYGNNGCNIINATYQYNPADSTLTFSNLVSTMMACGMEGITDIEINQALDASRYYTWRLNGDDYYLTLFDADHSEVMELMHQNFQFLNGTWAVIEIDGEAVNVPDMKLVIDVDEGKLHGNTGCNIINGSLETDMDAANSISFQGIGMTRMACPDGSHETQFIMALEQASKAKPLKDNQVALIDDQGKVVLLLERTSDK